jgi:hypothetical protein
MVKSLQQDSQSPGQELKQGEGVENETAERVTRLLLSVTNILTPRNMKFKIFSYYFMTVNLLLPWLQQAMPFGDIP